MTHGSCSSASWMAVLLACLCSMKEALAAQSVSYTYDALGRLVQSTITSGPGNGTVQGYQYDSASNRLQYQVSGVTGQNPVTLNFSRPVVNAIASGVALNLTVAGSSPTGTVTFTENGVFLGSTWVIDGTASIFLEGFALGTHTITVTYSGDGNHAPQTTVLTIKVQNLSWLPAVLDLLLSD